MSIRPSPDIRSPRSRSSLHPWASGRRGVADRLAHRRAGHGRDPADAPGERRRRKAPFSIDSPPRGAPARPVISARRGARARLRRCPPPAPGVQDAQGLTGSLPDDPVGFAGELGEDRPARRGRAMVPAAAEGAVVTRGEGPRNVPSTSRFQGSTAWNPWTPGLRVQGRPYRVPRPSPPRRSRPLGHQREF
jgi:hypothetical protein